MPVPNILMLAMQVMVFLVIFYWTGLLGRLLPFSNWKAKTLPVAEIKNSARLVLRNGKDG